MAYGLKQNTALVSLKLDPFLLKKFSFVEHLLLTILQEKKPSSCGNTEQDIGLKILEVLLIVQRKSKIPLFDSAVFIEKKEDGSYLYALPYMDTAAFKITLNWLVQTLQYLVTPSQVKPEQKRDSVIKTLIKLDARLKGFAHQGINAYKFVLAAYENSIPFLHVAGGVHSFGYGKNSRWLESTFSDQTGVISVNIARNKMSTNTLLLSCGFPVPYQKICPTVNDALSIAKQIGYPIVIKPLDNDGGRGVFAGIQSENILQKSYNEAQKYSKNILIEKHIHGRDYRLTVFNGKLIKTILRTPGGVTGDGKSTIKELVAKAQTNPQIARRSREKGLQILSLDEEALGLLEESGRTASYILKKDEFTALRRKANAYAGGITSLVEPACVHPDNCELVEQISKIMRLDFAGVDLLISDVGISWKDTTSAVCEVNAQPQIGDGNSPEIYKEILSQMLKGDGRIPIAVMIGEFDSQDVEFIEFVENVLEQTGMCMGVYYNGDVRIAKKSVTSNQDLSAVDLLLKSPEVELIFIFTNLKDINKIGFPVDRCNVLTVASKDEAFLTELKRDFNRFESYADKVLWDFDTVLESEIMKNKLSETFVLATLDALKLTMKIVKDEVKE